MGDVRSDVDPVLLIVCRLRQISFGLMLAHVGISFVDVFIYVRICIWM